MLRPILVIITAVWVIAMPLRAAATDLTVDVTIQGAPTSVLKDELKKLSNISAHAIPYKAMAPLRRAAQKDARTMQMALVSRGYFAAAVTPRFARDDLSVSVVFSIDSGERFTIQDYDITYTDGFKNDKPKTFADIGIETIDTPDGEQLARLETALLQHLRNNGYPAAKSLGRRVDARFADATGIAVFPIETGPKAYYGAIDISGTEKTHRNHLRALRPFKRNEVVSRADLDQYRATLADTGLFAEVTVEPGPPAPDGQTDIRVTVRERKRRTMGAGLSFGTDVGAGGTAFWQNRNFHGGGEVIAAKIGFSAPRQELSLTYDKPVPRLPGRWGLDTLLENEDTDAFTAQSISFGGGISQDLMKGALELSVKAQYAFSTITDSDATEDQFSSISFPIGVTFNNENDALNPTTGHRGRFTITPFLGSTSLHKAEFSGATRKTFGTNHRLTLAMRVALGATFGASGDTIPATERYFSGGGGSVRGYAYQLAGPLDSSGKPLGGTSFGELNLEARYKMTDAIQLATFVDSGSVFAEDFPTFSGNMPVGAGLGARYFTPVGPVRIDIAVPLNRRQTTKIVDSTRETTFEDDPLQIYIALGQPF